MMFQKPSRSARLLAQREERRERTRHEEREKAKVRRRDKGCRFPLCGCGKLKWSREVAHLVHKGAGGNPSGDRSLSTGMVYLCRHRHRDGLVSIHHGTLRVHPQAHDLGAFGPLVFEVDAQAAGMKAVTARTQWVIVATEIAPGRLEPLMRWQRELLEELAGMEI